jgi:hypothetical protein
MPVIEQDNFETWLNAPVEEALKLQGPGMNDLSAAVVGYGSESATAVRLRGARRRRAPLFNSGAYRS